jgi:hypothetical protein
LQDVTVKLSGKPLPVFQRSTVPVFRVKQSNKTGKCTSSFISFLLLMVKAKVRVTLQHAMKAHSRKRGTALLFL